MNDVQHRHFTFLDGLYRRRSHRVLQAMKQARAEEEKDGKDPVTIVCISDTHDHVLPTVPGGDVLIHAGDLTSKGTIEQVRAQLDWLKSLPHRHKIVVAGNHDRCLDDRLRAEQSSEPGGGKLSCESRPIEWADITYLSDSSTIVQLADGRALHVYGNPHTPRFGDFAFQYDPKSDYWAGRIPAEADIVVTHGPPLCHLDTNAYGGHVGCKSLLKDLQRVKPKVAIHGHIHEAHGEEVLLWDDLQVAWERAILTQGTAGDVIIATRHKIKEGIKKQGQAPLRDLATTRLINASIAGPNGYQDPIVLSVR